MKREQRLLLIERLVRENAITSQEELLILLEGTGMKCTQATLSRDLRQMGISRGFDGRGGYRYLLPSGREGYPYLLPEQRVVPDDLVPGRETEAITGMTWARGMLLINTPPGFAPAAAIKIDRAGRYEIAGTIAGDDTILLIPRDNISNEAIEECLKSIFG